MRSLIGKIFLVCFLIWISEGIRAGEMVLVPAGEFLMGAEEGREEEKPLHKVYLPAFYIDRYEVSNAEYAEFVKQTGASPPPHWGGKEPPPGTEDLPVTNVTWFEAMRYAIWAGKRLPTEAEWEKAARGVGGNVFPWGDVDRPDGRNLNSEKLRGVREYPQSASPYGCLNMAGNAWEWTADWYLPYPNSQARSVQFGKKYKIIRGGGAIGYYGAPNTGRCWERGYALPYGRYDGLGFRCVKDVDPAKAPYDPYQLLREAETLLKIPPPRSFKPSFEEEYESFLRKGSVPLKIIGEGKGYARIGVPFPKGLVKEVERLALLSPEGKPRLLQVLPLVRWEDGSLKWCLLDFPAKGGETCYLFLRSRSSSALPNPSITSQAGNVLLWTERFQVYLGGENILQLQDKEGKDLIKRVGFSLHLTPHKIPLLPLPPEVMIEEGGPLRRIILLKGSFRDDKGNPSSFRYKMRVHILKDSGEIRILLTLLNLAPREQEDSVEGVDLYFLLPQRVSKAYAGLEGRKVTLPKGKRVSITQTDDFHYEVSVEGERVLEGKRSDGWLLVKAGSKWCLFGLRHFWQNHPQALVLSPFELGVKLWARKESFLWEGGLAKTYELVLTFSPYEPASFHLEPLRVVIPPSWVAGTKVLGPLLPLSQESLSQFPYWEALVEESMRSWVRGMPIGMRDFGDAYYGGPYKGKNSYANLEYDVPFNFLLQFLRTGKVWYLEHAETQVRHQADIDINHFTGRPWKHSPLHTTTEADMGHIFLKGLLLYYLLTGDRTTLESAREIGDWLVERVARLEGIGNERQIGWPLYALTALYEVTNEERYLKSAEEASLKLARSQSPTGRFQIRWDNRISFFNGIAMAGFLSVYELTKKEEILEAVKRLGERTLGFYPEYACRTLNALSYLFNVTGDPRFFNLMERTWETSLDYLLPRGAVIAHTFSYQFFPYALFYPNFSLIKQNPTLSPGTWRFLRLNGRKIELFLRTKKGERLTILLEGLTKGRVEVLQKDKPWRRFELSEEGKLFQSLEISFPQGGVWRLLLLSEEPARWQLHYDGDISLTIYDPSGENLPNLYPRAFGFVKKGAKEILIRLEVSGEGFHHCVVYDEGGNILGAVKKFVDLGDEGHYELQLRLPLEREAEECAIEVYNAKVLEVKGVLPYWAGRREESFFP